MFDTILLLAGAAEQSILPLALRGHNPLLTVIPVGSAAELAALDGLWLGGVLSNVWRVLEDRLAAADVTTHGLDWNFDQIAKTRPYKS